MRDDWVTIWAEPHRFHADDVRKYGGTVGGCPECERLMGKRIRRWQIQLRRWRTGARVSAPNGNL